jgi:hypothetical protein
MVRTLPVLAGLVLAFATGEGLPAFAEDVASDLTVQGQRLPESGEVRVGSAEVEVRITSVQTSSRQDQILFAELHDAVMNDDGLFALRLGDGEPLAGSVSDVVGSEKERFVEILIDGTPVGTRERLAALPSSSRELALDPPSPELRVFDGDGKELGIYAGERLLNGDRYFVHRQDVGLTLALRADSGGLGIPDLEIFYPAPDCEGRSLVARKWSGVVFGETKDGYLVGTATLALPPLTIASRRIGIDGSCESWAGQVSGMVPVTAIESLPVELPVALPIHVGVVDD